MELKEVCEKIWIIENEMDLLNQSIKNIYFWEIVRFDIYSLITIEKGILDKAHRQDSSIRRNIKKNLEIIKNTIINNPFMYKNKVNYLIYDHERKPKIEDENIDIYTKYILERINNDSLIIEDSFNGKHLSDKLVNRKYTDAIKVISKIDSIFKRVILTKEEQILVNNIENKINEVFSINVNISKIIKEKITQHISRCNIYKKLILKLEVKTLILVVSYCKQEICQAAKELGVKVIELQHGVISKYHMGYSYPTNRGVHYFPDYLLVYGEYWIRDYIPIAKENIINYGFEHFNNRKKALDNVEKIKNEILFISQGTIGNKLSSEFFKVASKMKQYKFKYKLHPGEYCTWRKDYTDLYKASLLENVQIIDNSEIDLYYYFKKANIVVGVYSTAIYEAMGLECKVILVDLPGLEYMKELIATKVVNVANESKDIIKFIEEDNFNSNLDFTYFFNNKIDFIDI